MINFNVRKQTLSFSATVKVNVKMLILPAMSRQVKVTNFRVK